MAAANSRGASSGENTYPSRLAAELRAHWPTTHIEVLNKGVGGETDVDMMRRVDTDVLAYKPDLVIWQLGTNAVLKEDGVTRDAPRIKAGIERLKAADADGSVRAVVITGADPAFCAGVDLKEAARDGLKYFDEFKTHSCIAAVADMIDDEMPRVGASHGARR